MGVCRSLVGCPVDSDRLANRQRPHPAAATDCMEFAFDTCREISLFE